MLLVAVWGLVGCSLILYLSFLNDKPKIIAEQLAQQEQQQQQQNLTPDQAVKGVQGFLHNTVESTKIPGNSSGK